MSFQNEISSNIGNMHIHGKVMMRRLRICRCILMMINVVREMLLSSMKQSCWPHAPQTTFRFPRDVVSGLGPAMLSMEDVPVEALLRRTNQLEGVLRNAAHEV